MKRMAIKDWEIQQNIISIRKEEDFKLKTQLDDTLETEDNNNQQKQEEEAIRDKYDRTYFPIRQKYK